MNLSVYRISLDVHDAHSGECLDMKQKDTARQIAITLTDGGFPYQIGEECYAVFAATKADGKKLRHYCSIEKNTILYEVRPQTTAAVGLMECEIKLYGSGDKLLMSPGFSILVSEDAVTDDEELESQDEVDDLTHLISEATTVITEGKAVNAEGEALNQESEALIADMEAKRTELEQQIADAAASAGAANKSAIRAESAANSASSSASLAATKAKAAADSEANAKASENAAKTSAGSAANLANAALQSQRAAEAAADRAEAAAEQAGNGSDSGQNPTVELDTTLTVAGKAADAKAVGDKIAAITGISLVEPAEDDIPNVHFTVKGGMPFTKAEGDVQVLMRYISKTATIERHCTAKVQGGSSADNQDYKKRNWTIKVYKDSTYAKKDKLSFKGWPAMNKFVLKAGWVIPGHLRNVGAAKIWGQIMRSRSDYDTLPEELRNSPNQGATDGFHVRVFINGMYWGIYDWIVAKDQLFGQDNDNTAHSILNSEWNNQPTCAFATTTPTVSGNWSEELLDDMTAETKTSMENWIKFVAGSTDDEFVANAENYFDVQTVIDAICFDRIIMPVDNLCRNQIVFKYAEKWFMGKWDLDAILGLPPVAGQGWFPYNTAYQKGYVAYRDFGINNMLYSRTEKLFLERFKENYWRLRSGPLSEANLVDVFGRLSDRLRSIEGLLAEENASTTGDGQFTAMPNVKTDTIQQIREFVSKRCAFMDAEVENMGEESGEGGGETPDTPDTPEAVPCTGISLDKSTLTFTAETPQELIATVTPDGCTDEVIWSSDNENIAVVNGGLVTPMMDGSCNITATCGNYSATCAVTVADGLFGDSAQLVTLVNNVGVNGGGNRVYSNTNAVINDAGSFSTSDWNGFGTSDYTELKEGFDLIEVVGTKVKIGFYDSEKTLIGGSTNQNGNTLICDIPADAVYFRVCVLTTGMTAYAVSVRYGYVADHKIAPTWKDGNAYTISEDGSIADGNYYMTERVEIPDGISTILIDSRSYEKYKEYIYAVYDADGNLLTRRAEWMTGFNCFKCSVAGLVNPAYAYFGMKNPTSGATGTEQIEAYAF